MVLIVLSLLRVVISFASVPLRFQNVASMLTTVVFIAAPIFALFAAARYKWSAKSAVIFVTVGLVIHLELDWGLVQSIGGHGFFAAVCTAVGSQCGFTMWCAGLGALLASILKDRNLLIPVSIFLAGFDIYLVVTPLGGTHLALQSQTIREVFKTVAYSVPAPTATPTGGKVQELAFMGPADFLFMGMFFVALFRFNLRTRATLYCLIPAVLVAIGLAFKFGSAMPMMVPIGLTVLLVNLPEFKMTTEEKISTLVVLGLVAAAILGSYFLGKRSAPSQKAPAPTVSAPARSPAPAAPSPHR